MGGLEGSPVILPNPMILDSWYGYSRGRHDVPGSWLVLDDWLSDLDQSLIPELLFP